MAAWKYIKGSEKDFECAPEWATVLFGPPTGRSHGFAEKWKKGANYTPLDDLTFVDALDVWVNTGMVIAQRERVTSINDDRLAQDVAAVNPKYNRPCKGVTIDVYDVLQAFSVTNPALQHLVKKALAVGQRGHKDKMEDLHDILASAQRAIELEESGK